MGAIFVSISVKQLLKELIDYVEQVKMTDLRGAALVVAGLAAHGTTSIYGLNHLNRGIMICPKTT